MANFAKALTHHRKAAHALKRGDGKTAAHHMGHAMAALRTDRHSLEGTTMGGNWIKGAIKHPGGLHKALGVPQGQKIPAAKVATAKQSSNPHVAAMARLAGTLKKLNQK